MCKKCNDPLNEFDSDEEDHHGDAMDIRPSHKVTRLSSPAKKRGVSGSPSKRY
jgi:hypothetical protein